MPKFSKTNVFTTSKTLSGLLNASKDVGILKAIRELSFWKRSTNKHWCQWLFYTDYGEYWTFLYFTVRYSQLFKIIKYMTINFNFPRGNSFIIILLIMSKLCLRILHLCCKIIPKRWLMVPCLHCETMLIWPKVFQNKFKILQTKTKGMDLTESKNTILTDW